MSEENAAVRDAGTEELPLETPPQQQAIAPGHKQRLETLKDLFEKAKPQIAAVIPKHLTAERLLQVALVACSRDPKLLLCSGRSVLQAVMVAAKLGLDASGTLGSGYLVPYRRKGGGYDAHFIPGYRGLTDLAMRSGFVDSIEAQIVHAKDEFSFVNTEEGPQLRHKPELYEDPGEPKLVFAVARMKGSTIPKIEIMTKAQVDGIRKRSQASESGPWQTDYEEMARKTVVRRICKYLPLSVEFQTATEAENRAESGEAPLIVLEEGTGYESAPLEPLAGATERVKESLEKRRELLKQQAAEVLATEAT
jgi:recombination protein RecT